MGEDASPQYPSPPVSDSNANATVTVPVPAAREAHSPRDVRFESHVETAPLAASDGQHAPHLAADMTRASESGKTDEATAILKPSESMLDTPVLHATPPAARLSASLPSTPTHSSPPVIPSLTHRRSLGRTSQPKRRMSGNAGTGTASHFSKPIEMPLAGLRIEATGASPVNVSPFERVQSGGDLSKKMSSGKDDAPANVVEVQSPIARREATKSGNALKQITKVVPTISKIATGGSHRKKVKDGEVVFKGHRNWEIVLSIQFGLRYTSELLEDASGAEPTERDYRESLAFDFNPVDDAHSVFDVNKFAKWVHPAPFVYRLIREKFGVSENDFLEATCSESRVRELPTPGKSGALFYITDDENYFMKTIQHIEEKMLLFMLPSYYEHICRNPDTLLTKYLAHFSVQTRRDRHIRMVVMASIFNDQIFIDRKYDLKGSTYKRFASTEQLESENVTLKDQDFDEAVYFRPEVLEKIMTQLKRDSSYLEYHNVMDYSLLLGLSDMMPEEDESFKTRYGPNEDGAPYFVGYQKDSRGRKSGVRVCMGIIDFLQRFRFRKKVEYAGRVMQSCSTSAASVAPPHLYRERFMTFLQTRFLPDPDLDVSKLLTTKHLESQTVPVVSNEKPVDDDDLTE